ncbi:coiled-coil domain-containing protein 113-like [Argiope bruennichi]|uniref:DUF4201 domain-containing protein n=1 Tax=Argiope bruennichi TaxID=94029 RepID=A0A8T0ED47_ARGBR|nr:coiled-coil domain-containing protein 113-like [Argiope bruennichi]KAF8770553.1 hypothetical protein HNY73_018063 [Argiope bruennichi]
MEDSEGKLLNTNNNNTESFENERDVSEQPPNLNEKVDYQELDRWRESADFDEFKLHNYLNNLSEESLSALLKDINEANNILVKENDIYEFVLKHDDTVHNVLEMLDMDIHSQTSEDTYSPLSYPAKCYFAHKRLKSLEEDLERKLSFWKLEVQDLECRMKSISLSLEALKEEQETFNKNVRFGGRNPVTKRVILQKVAKYFDDSIKHKMAMTNRYKIQIQSDIMERNKLACQFKEQEKRLASLDLMKYKEAKFEHDKSCKALHKHKEQLSKCKSKYSFLLQSIADIKKSLEKEGKEIQELQAAVSKKEAMKNVMLSEKTRNDQRVAELNAAMRKIQLDPRRHGLPEVAEYAVVKKENEILKRNIKKWRKKVAVAEQAKLMHLSALKKKAKHK